MTLVLPNTVSVKKKKKLPFIKWWPYTLSGFPGGTDSKESACNAGDPGLIPGLEDPVEKGMATHSSILAWRIPWTEETGGLQSMGSHRIRHDWACMCTYTLLFKLGYRREY